MSLYTEERQPNKMNTVVTFHSLIFFFVFLCIDKKSIQVSSKMSSLLIFFRKLVRCYVNMMFILFLCLTHLLGRTHKAPPSHVALSLVTQGRQTLATAAPSPPLPSLHRRWHNPGGLLGWWRRGKGGVPSPSAPPPSQEAWQILGHGRHPHRFGGGSVA
jgi:hypothetical protein